MSRNELAVVLVGICVGLTACDHSPADEVAGPGPPTPDAAASATLSAPKANYVAVTLSKRAGSAYGINSRAEIVGDYELTVVNGGTSFTAFHAFVWKGGVLRDVGTLGSRPESTDAGPRY